MLVIFSCSKDNELENSNINTQENFVKLSQAKEIAGEIFFETKSNSTASRGITDEFTTRAVETIDEVKNEKGKTSFYIINYTEGGFILLSADNRTQPILGFSEVGKFEVNAYPLGLKSWIKNAKKQITDIQDSNIKQSKNEKAAWEQVQDMLSSQNIFSKPPPDDCYEHTDVYTIGPLLSSTWYQWGGFNDALPIITCNGFNFQVYAGCVPIAMGQIMKYHEYTLQITIGHQCL